ncbi:S-layer homology domain-containing protein [Cohnella thailandensis]|uniref:RICIN domain-containing protein n=1 Tax=Cohnella thailandensis TaxID=557557 RepID=A0A841SV00_9BACL|nr:S-layer homology domain-containing protein [Cohnella thailandensis]MBB6634426.1 RICIN domain-containing protein [Cohnella thailandensis]MBP1972074.1 hypothetical protein [Cohnella thailandensis]
MALIRKLIASVLALVLLSPLGALASVSAETDSPSGGGAVSGGMAGDSEAYVRFKNQWQGTYLYEDSAGKVRYGYTAVEDPAAQWLLEEAGDGLKTIRNKATGRYLNMASVVPSDKITQPLESTDISPGLTTALWKVQDSEPGYVNVVSADFSNRVLNIQTLDGFAHVNDWAQASWGSAQWQLEPASDLAPVRIVDQWQGGYLYEADGVVKVGRPAMNDASSHWYAIDAGDGKKRLRNRATGHFVNVANVIASEDKTIPISVTELGDGAVTEWTMTASGEANVYGLAIDGYPELVLNVQSQDGFAHWNNWAQPGWGSAQWRLEPASDTLPVRLKDQWQGQYLFEQNGVVAYGTPAATDKSSQWLVESAASGTTLRNLGSGNYVVASASGEEAADVRAKSVAGTVYDTDWTMNAAVNDAGGSVSGYYTFSVPGAEGNLLNVQAQDGFAHANDWAQPTWGSAQWKLEDPLTEPEPENPDPTYIRIRNSWLQLYLYEENGIVKYGNAASGDQAAQWQLVDAGDGKTRIQNRATGHFVTLEGVDGSRAAVRAGDLAEGSTAGDWVVVDYQGLKLIRSAGDRSENESAQSYLNVENKLKTLQYGIVPRDWGSPKWEFLPVSEDASGYVRLKNGYRGSYLYEEDGIVKDGQPDLLNAASHWELKQGQQGTLIVNRATGHLITNENVGSYEDPLESLALDPTWGSVQWTVEDVDGAEAKVLRSVWKNNVLIHDEDNKGFAQASDIPANWGSAQWLLEEAPELPAELPEGFVRIQNRQTGQYLFENGRQVVRYGTPDASDASSHWSFVVGEDGNVSLVNRATGRAMSIENGRAYLETSGAIAEDSSSWRLEEAGAAGYYLLRSAAAGHDDEYIHLADGLGFAQYDLVSAESQAAQWKLENAPDEAVPPSVETDDLNGSTAVLKEKNVIRIASERSGELLAMSGTGVTYEAASSNSLSAAWIAESYNGHKRFKNVQTGLYLAANASGDALIGSAVGGERAAQWDVTDVLGYKTIRSASAPELMVAQGNGGSARWTFEPIPTTASYAASEAFASGGVALPAASDGFAGGFSGEGASLLWSVHAEEARSYAATIAYRNASGATGKLGLYVNGLKAGTLKLASTGENAGTLPVELKLREGFNTVALRYEDDSGTGLEIGSLKLAKSVYGASRGATVPYLAYELEDAATNGLLIGPGRDYGTVAAESSGRKAVRLDEEGQYAEFKAAEAANALTLRYVIPDSADGSGLNATLSLYVNGEKRQSLELSSKHSWVYGKYPYSNNPADGDAHRFYEEAHFLVGDIPAGATVRLQRDAGDSAEYYVLDLAELERAPEAYAMPDEGYRSVTEFGAAPNDGVDDSSAFRAAIATAHEQGFGLWVPAGSFDLSGGPLGVAGVTIRGAGMWHTELRGEGFMGVGSNVGVYDLLLDVGVTGRHDAEKEAGFDGAFGTGSTIQNVWIEHAKAGIWTTLSDDLTLNTDGLYVGGVRVRNTYADGIHLSTGTRNSVVEHSVLRNTGDDSIALWSDQREGTTAEQARTQNNKIRFNTVQLPYLADNVAVFGGTDNQVTDNLLADTMGYGAGIAVSTRFDPVPFGGTTRVERNTLLRTGGHEASWNQDFGAIWIFVENKPIDADILIQNNEAIDSTFQGLYVSGPNSINASGAHKVIVRNYVIDGAGTWGINVAAGVTGSVELQNVLIRNAKVGRLFSTMGDSFKLNAADPVPEPEQPDPVLVPDDGGAGNPGPGTGIGTGNPGGSGEGDASDLRKRASEGDKKLADALSDGAGVIEFAGREASGEAAAVFSSKALREAASKKPSARILVSLPNAEYELTLAQAAALLGKAADDALLELTIRELDQAMATLLNGAARREGVTPIAKGAFRFEAALHSDGETSPITNFGRLFLDRRIIVDQELDPNASTVLLFDPAAGSLRYVPALFEIAEDERTSVTIRSAHNGIFVLASSARAFADLQGHWAQKDLQLLANKRIASGDEDGRFSPNRPMTRAEFTALLVRSLGLTGTGEPVFGFADVAPGAWYAAEANAAAEFGLVQGDEAGRFRPSEEITREQMAVLLARAMELVRQSLENGSSSAVGAPPSASANLAGFADAGRVSPWAAEALNRLLSEGILNGTSETSLSPQGLATRAEGAVLLERMLKALKLL